jgi:hypothetical protein
MGYLGAMILFLSVIVLVIAKGLIYSKSLEKEKRIPVDDIELIDCTIDYPHAFAPRLKVKIINKSTQSTLKTVVIRIGILDDDIGKDNIILSIQRYLKVNIPPGKSDHLSEFIGITEKKNLRVRKRCVCEIIESRGFGLV